MIDWGRHGEYPAVIWGFLDLSQMPEGITVRLTNRTIIQKGVWAVIESCNIINEVKGRRGIFQKIVLETKGNDDEGNPDPGQRKFYLVEVDTFKRPLVVIPNIGTKCEFLMMNPKSQWAEDFKSWLDAPHTVDEEQMRSPEVSEEEEEENNPGSNDESGEEEEEDDIDDESNGEAAESDDDD
jgi:hypothetical protein